MASNLSWNPVSVNFNDASSLMRNAGDSISKAGTVFGELRKSILDEEQRRIENEFNQKKLDENIRQFEANLGLQRDQLTETGRHNLATETLDKARNDITAQHYRWTHEDNIAQAKATADYRNMMAQSLSAERQERVAKAQREAGIQDMTRLAGVFASSPANMQLGIVKKLEESAVNGNPFAASVLPSFKAWMENPNKSPSDAQAWMLGTAAMLSGDPNAISKAADYSAKRDQEKREIWKDRNKVLNQIAQSNLELAKQNISEQHVRDIDENATFIKGVLAQDKTLQGKELLHDTGATVMDLAKQGSTTASWLGWLSGNPGASLNLKSTFGDIGPENRLGFFSSDMRGEDRRAEMMIDAILDKYTANGQPLTLAQRTRAKERLKMLLSAHAGMFGTHPIRQSLGLDEIDISEIPWD
jgi:hypothetical protein